MKIPFALCILLLIILQISGCGKIDVAQTPQTQKGATVPPKAVEEKWQTVLAAARKEGTALLYGETSPTVRQELGNAIKSKFGIELEFVSAKGAEIATRFLKEKDANLNLADVLISGESTTVNTLKPRGVLAPLEPELIFPEVTDPKAWPDGKIPYFDKDKLSVPLVLFYRTWILRNSDLVVKDEIRSYQDLLNPKWKGKIIIYDPTVLGSGSAWFGFMLTKLMNLQDGEKYVRELVKLEPFVTRDARLQVEWVARGKYPVAIAPSGPPVDELVKAGAPLAWVTPVEGGVVAPGASVLSLPLIRPHPNAASVVGNWLLTSEGQRRYSLASGNPAARLGVSTEGIDPGLVPPTGVKLHRQDEEFHLTVARLEGLRKDIFGPLIK